MIPDFSGVWMTAVKRRISEKSFAAGFVMSISSQDLRTSEKWTQIDRILNSSVFKGCEKLRQPLRYLLQKSIENVSRELSEYRLGLEAFGKPESFNPEHDRSVAQNLGRLRRKLREYSYSGLGRQDPFIVSIPSGGYEVRFERRRTYSQSADEEEARGWYERGRQLWIQETPVQVLKAIEYFEKALQICPDYVEAYTALSEAYLFLAICGWPAEMVMPEAEFNAKQALRAATELGLHFENLAEAHAALGVVKSVYYWDWNGGETEFLKALGLNRESVGTHCWYSGHLFAMGRLNEAVKYAGTARRLQPGIPSVVAHAGKVFYFARRYEEAIALLSAVVDMIPNYYPALWPLGLTYAATGATAKALALFEKVTNESPDNVSALAFLAHAHSIAGNPGRAHELLDKLLGRSAHQHVSAIWPAIVYSGLGLREAAFESLTKAMEERAFFLASLKTFPLFDSLRPDWRFGPLLNKMGLEADSTAGL